MSNDLFNKRKEEFIVYINSNHKLPRVWEARFSDNTDMRLWFNKISRNSEFVQFVGEISSLLLVYDYELLNDNDKCSQFMDYISVNNHIPMYGNAYFTDDDEMSMWYRNYILKNPDFEREVCESLSEYKELDLAMFWTDVRSDFIKTIKSIKRMPKYREFIVSNGVDVRVILDKLATFDPRLYDMLILYMFENKSRGLSFDEREEQFISWISSFQYIPELQEARFSDGVDMFTWYTKYSRLVPRLRETVKSIANEKIKGINIYLIPEFNNKDGKFYIICSNEGEKLDISGIKSISKIKKIDPTFNRCGSVVLKKDEKIKSIIIGDGSNEN